MWRVGLPKAANYGVLQGERCELRSGKVSAGSCCEWVALGCESGGIFFRSCRTPGQSLKPTPVGPLVSRQVGIDITLPAWLSSRR